MRLLTKLRKLEQERATAQAEADRLARAYVPTSVMWTERVGARVDLSALREGEARYRAQYGRALMHRPNSRRIAETELQAAVALEPNNASFHVMLGELYQRVGLRRRAEGEAARALAADPGNRAARALLASLKNK